MLAVGVLEEIIDSVLLHQTTDERQIGFAVLHAVGDFLVVAVGAKFEVVEARLGEDVLDDVLDVLVEKNAAVRSPAKHPQPWSQHDLVVMVVFELSDPLRLGHDAVVDALLAFISLELDRASLTERLVEVDVLLFAQCFDLKLEQLAKRLGAFDVDQHEHIFAERRLELGDAFGLAQLPSHAYSPSDRSKTQGYRPAVAASRRCHKRAAADLPSCSKKTRADSSSDISAAAARVSLVSPGARSVQWMTGFLAHGGDGAFPRSSRGRRSPWVIGLRLVFTGRGQCETHWRSSARPGHTGSGRATG